MIIFRLFCDALLIVLSYIVPKKKRLVIFGAALGTQYNGNPKYVMEYLIANNITDYSFYWITKKKSVFRQYKNEIPIGYLYSFFSFYLLLRSEFFIIDHYPSDIFPFGETTLGRFKFINTWHGSFIKQIGKLAVSEGGGRYITSLFKLGLDKKKQIIIKSRLYDFLLKFDVMLASSELVGEQLGKAFNAKNIYVMGYPRNDIFFTPGSKKAIGNLSLDTYEKIFLYAPTFRDHSTGKKAFSQNGFSALNAYLTEEDGVLLIKVHPFDNNFNIITDNFSRIHNITQLSTNINDVLKFTSCLITDYSSVCFDYSLTNRPMIFYQYDFCEYQTGCRSIIKENEKLLPGPFVYTENELLASLMSMDVWFKELNYRLKYENFRNAFNKFQDGGYSEAFVRGVFKDIQ